jgi:hypothetical protein
LKKKARLGVSMWTGMGVRNICYSGLIKYLQNDFDIVLYSPYECEDCKTTSYLNRFLKRKCGFYNFLYKVLYLSNYYAMYKTHKTKTVEKYMERDRGNSWHVYIIFNALSWLILKIRKDNAFDFLRDSIYSYKGVNFNDIDILFVTSTDTKEDQILMYMAKKNKVPVVSLVHSWDNLPARGFLPTVPDRLLVWNGIMKEQAMDLHDIPSEKIDIVGIPQYQKYLEILSEFEICKHEEKLSILYTCSAIRVFPDEEEFIDTLLGRLSLIKGAELVIRLHPEERKKLYLFKYRKYKNIRISNPDNSFRAVETSTESMSDRGIVEFLSLINCSDVVINLASTITLDAILCDTPVICPMFNISLEANSWNSALKWYDSSHFSKIKESGAVYLPKDMDELMQNIESAILRPKEKNRECKILSQDMMPIIDSRFEISKSLKEALQ